MAQQDQQSGTFSHKCLKCCNGKNTKREIARPACSKSYVNIIFACEKQQITYRQFSFIFVALMYCCCLYDSVYISVILNKGEQVKVRMILSKLEEQKKKKNCPRPEAQ